MEDSKLKSDPCPHSKPITANLVTGNHRGPTNWKLDCARPAKHHGKHQSTNPTITW